MNLRESISKYFPIPKVPIPANQTKKAYGKVQMTLNSSLIKSIQKLSDSCVQTELPESFEKLGQGYGFILYSTILRDSDLTKANLSIPGIRDRGYVVVGNVIKIKWKYVCLDFELLCLLIFILRRQSVHL